jgi:hypothetical protein
MKIRRDYGMTTDSIRIKGPRTLFVLHLIISYTVAVALWTTSTDSLGIDVAYYKYTGFIYVIRDRFIDLILILLSMSSITAWRGIKRAQVMMRSRKAGALLVLDVIIICVVMINIMGIINYFIHIREFSAASTMIILVVQFTYTMVGIVMGIVIGPALVMINWLWLKWFRDEKPIETLTNRSTRQAG